MYQDDFLLLIWLHFLCLCFNDLASVFVADSDSSSSSDDDSDGHKASALTKQV